MTDHVHDDAAPWGAGPSTRARVYRILLSMSHSVIDDETIDSDSINRVMRELGSCAACYGAMVFYVCGLVMDANLATPEVAAAQYQASLLSALEQIDNVGGS